MESRVILLLVTFIVFVSVVSVVSMWSFFFFFFVVWFEIANGRKYLGSERGEV